MIQSLPLISQDRCRSKAIQDYSLQSHYFLLVEGQTICSIGDKVSEGQLLIFDKDRFLRIYSPVNGIIQGIQIFHGKEYLTIKRDGLIPLPKYEFKDPDKVAFHELISRIERSGIHHSFSSESPPHIRISEAIGQVHTIVVNGLDPEPFMASEFRLLLEKTKEIIQAAQRVKSIVESQKIIIAIYQHKVLKNLIEQFIFDEDISVCEIPNSYPLAHSHLLLNLISKKELPRFTSEIASGYLNFSATTFYHFYEALFYEKPVTDKIISIDGAFSLEYGNFRVKIGTPISAFMRPYTVESTYVMFSGGPLTGKELDKEKSTHFSMPSIMIFEGKLASKEEDCIFCGLCVRHCPVRLNPLRLVDFMKHQEKELALAHSIDQCIACNLCSYVCPSMIPLGLLIQQGQKQYKGESHA